MGETVGILAKIPLEVSKTIRFVRGHLLKMIIKPQKLIGLWAGSAAERLWRHSSPGPSDRQGTAFAGRHGWASGCSVHAGSF